jgi:anti-sigma B factor antagonist
MAARRYFFVHGEIDLAAAPTLHAELYEATATNADDLVVDCSGLTFVDSTGIAVLIATCQTLRGQGRGFRIINTSAMVQRTLDLVGVADLLQGRRSHLSA